MEKSILILDDVPMNQSLICSFVKMYGFKAHAVSDGIEGIKSLEDNDYQMIFSDIEMPNMNGLEFLSTIKQNEKFKHIPVVMISSVKKQEEIDKILKLGAIYYIVKPFTKDKMEEALKIAHLL